jgi:starvation-inducible DNA-binding protein
MHRTQMDIPEEKRRELIRILNSRLADAIDLGLQSKQAHWNVKGPSFIALHELFDEVASVADEQSDEIAERVAALGGVAEGTLAAVTPRTQLPSYDLSLTSGKSHVAALSAALATFGRAVRADIELAEDLGDAGTADLFTGISRAVDKQLWFVEAHLQADA